MTEESETSETEPTDDRSERAEAVRRQQLWIGVGVAVLGGGAGAVAGVQQLGLSPGLAAAFGTVVLGCLLWLVYVGLYRGQE